MTVDEAGIPAQPPRSPDSREMPEHPEPVPRARTPTMVVLGPGVLLVLLIVLAVGAAPRVGNRRALAASAEKARNAVPGVYVFQPRPAPAAGLELAGTTQAIEDAVIYARASGYLRKRHVDIGDQVRSGQLLAEIESPEIEQQLSQGRAKLRQSQKNLDLQRANLDLARITMGRYQAADAEKAVAIEAVDQSVAAFRTAQASVAAAEEDVASNQSNVRRLEELASFQRVLAPFSGTVIQRNVDVGALITAGSPTDNTAVAPTNLTGAPNGLFEVARLDRLRVFVNVPQEFATNVRTGLPAQVTVRGQGDTSVPASVTRTSGALDPGTRTLLAQVDIPNPKARLLPGMFVYVTFTIAPSGMRWRIPATAVVFDAHGSRVAIVGPQDTIRFQPVELGRDLGDSFDVQGGLQGKETIVLQPTVALQEGQVVRPIAPRSTPSK